MSAPVPLGPRRDERGNSTTVFVLVSIPALLLISGLVIDGGAQAVAARRAEAVAQGAARAAGDASTTARLAGRDGSADALTAARQYVAAAPDVTATVSYSGGRVRVVVDTGAPTTFLSAIGVARLPAHASADSVIVTAR